MSYETLHGAYLGVDEAKIDYIGEEKPEKAYDLEKDRAAGSLPRDSSTATAISP